MAGAGLLCGLIDEMIDDPDVTDWWVPALAGALPIWDEHTAEGWQHALNTAHAGNTALSRELVGVLRPGLKQWDAAGEEAYAVVTDLVRDMFDLSMVTTQPGG